MMDQIRINSVIKENENQDADFLVDLDSYLDDINNRLTVSRFVSDSVTRGVLNAVETEAAEKIAQQEIVMSRLKETLLLYHVCSEENETSCCSRLILDQACNGDEYKERLWEQNMESCGKKSLLLDQKTKEIAGLRPELELISKLLSGYENEDIDEALESQTKLQRKISGSIGSTSSIWDTDGKHTEGLRHLSHEELINHLKIEINQNEKRV